jgi:deoxyadenosine/deoxycytidine kinase
MDDLLQIIEICGGIASGKTTFAGLLSTLGWEVVYEAFGTNPFCPAALSPDQKTI